MPQRTDYNQIAHLYDAEAHRRKSVDLDLVEFLALRDVGECSILDIGCGTGSQLAANRAQYPALRMVGLDRFGGMLRQAKNKAVTIDWSQGDAANFPFASQMFDFITSQLSFHHVQNKSAMIEGVFRILRRGGRFVITNFDPHETESWAVYRYFPAAKSIDLQDFPSINDLQTLLAQSGFNQINSDRQTVAFEQTLPEFAAEVRRRVTSQLRVISEIDYQTGLRRIEAELAQPDGQTLTLTSKICMAKVMANKP